MNEFMENATVETMENVAEMPAKENETKAEKFIRLGEYRMNKAMDAIGRLEHLANRSAYEYTQKQVDAMFTVLETRIAEIRKKFDATKDKEAKASFSFGSLEE